MLNDEAGAARRTVSDCAATLASAICSHLSAALMPLSSTPMQTPALAAAPRQESDAPVGRQTRLLAVIRHAAPPGAAAGKFLRCSAHGKDSALPRLCHPSLAGLPPTAHPHAGFDRSKPRVAGTEATLRVNAGRGGSPCPMRPPRLSSALSAPGLAVYVWPVMGVAMELSLREFPLARPATTSSRYRFPVAFNGDGTWTGDCIESFARRSRLLPAPSRSELDCGLHSTDAVCGLAA